MLMTRLLLSANSPKTLDRAIDILLTELCVIFAAHGFQMNWAPKRSDAIVKYRGKCAKEANVARMHEGCAKIRLPTCADREFLIVVDEYKHVGSIVSADGSISADAMQRSKSANFEQSLHAGSQANMWQVQVSGAQQLD